MYNYTIIRDTRERKKKGWYFDKYLEHKLEEGDYTIAGLEGIFVIERKGSSSEFYKNLVEERFDDELKRLESYRWSFVVLEFELRDLVLFPWNSGIPKRLWPRLRMKPAFLLQRLNDFQLQYKTKFIFAGKHGKEIALSLFDNVAKSCRHEIQTG